MTTKLLWLVGLTVSALSAMAADDALVPKPYPLATCVVSGEKLDSDPAKVFSFKYEDREIQMCCESCQKDFKENAASYLKKLDAAEKKATAEHPYPLKTCVVSGKKLGEMGKPVVFVAQDREIKLCCKGCLKEFAKNPVKYAKLLAQAEPKK